MNESKKPWQKPQLLGLKQSRTKAGFVPGTEGQTNVHPGSNSTHWSYSTVFNSPNTTTTTEVS